MHEDDYAELQEEGAVIMAVHRAIQMWNDKQHHARLYEYALAQKALKQAYGTKIGLQVADVGCGAGYLSPILYWLGHNVTMYEIWTFGNEEDFALEQMRRVGSHRAHLGGQYGVRHRALGGLTNEDRGFDVAFCISTLEHIKDYQNAFRDLCRMVKPGGLIFVTTDFAEDEEDHYEFSYLRAGKMFNKDTYEELQKIGEAEGLHLFGGKHWEWKEECRLVADYGFCSLAMLKGTE